MYVYTWFQDLMYKNNVSNKERKEKIHDILTTSLKKKIITTLPLTKWSQKLTLPLRVTTFIAKTTPPFCHEWQKVECQVDISSVELASPSSSEASSSSPSSSALESKATGWGGEGVGIGAKPPIVACRHAIRPTRAFTWYNSVESVSRRASMRCSCAMTSPKDTSPEKEGANADGVDRDGAEWEEGVAEFICRDRNWASLRLTVA